MNKLSDEEVVEAIAQYSEEKIIISVFEEITSKQSRKILSSLIEDWGEIEDE